MKQLILSFICIFLHCHFSLFAQSLEVSWDKTTVLIFDAPIQAVDRGSRKLLGQQDDSALNMLKLKAGSRELPPTTLHVLTTDGNLHEFQVQYAESPSKTTWDLRGADKRHDGLISSYNLRQEEMEQILENLAEQGVKSLRKQSRYEISLELKGIYYQEGLLLFDLRLSNHSPIPFVISGPEFRIVDSKGKTQSTQREQILTPWLTATQHNSETQLGEEGRMLLAFPAFTIANHKRLLIQLSETRGDRELELKIPGRKLLEAKTLPMFHTKPTTAYGSGEL